MPQDADASSGPRLKKSPSAFRTISEVAAELEVPQHVLRFWETKFPQVRPLKRGGGRRYYRPSDVALLRRIRELLYRDGYTIKGVQRLLREEGVRTVVAARPAEGAGEARLRPVLETVLHELEELRDLLRRPPGPD